MKLVVGFDPASAILARRLDKLTPEASPGLKKSIFATFGQDLTVEQVVQRVIEDVKNRGDVAVRDYAGRFDGVQLTSLEVNKTAIEAAMRSAPAGLVSALEYAARRIRDFHEALAIKTGLHLRPDGSGVMVQPLQRVGMYVPGGRACYPSTVLMTVLPAKAAGVKEVILSTPPSADGSVPAPTLVAASVAGVDRVFMIGGAQAIAAMAFGTDSVPRVDKICGPGNIFVMMAKKAVYGIVDIDGLQGPSELAVVADESANVAFCAADLLAQGEHDPLASVVLIATSEEKARQVEREVERQMTFISRSNIAQESVLKNGVLAVVMSIEQAVQLVNLYAPEHVSLMVEDATRYVPLIRNAGCIFVGKHTAPALGDFVAGPSHVLPTGGTARFGSPLGVADFLKVTSVVNIFPKALSEMAGAACTVARVEGFDAHCKSIELRIQGGK
ncbi:MAG: histidinol dehydrogenase [Chloroflexi bacterium]|nr:histidinol dehydrogenase [Chloroflexota bacterium]